MASKKTLGLGLSPCPNDTFIFHALLHGLAAPDLLKEFNIMPHMADVEELNRRALAGELEISKISAGVLPRVLDKYRVLSSGGALGWGVGPLLVSARQLGESERARASIAIPGGMTTANMLLSLHGAFNGPRKEMLFNEVIPAAASGKVDAGLVIHEGRFTYQKRNLQKILDLGEWWESEFNAPLPLGVIVIRRDLALDTARAVEKAIAESVSLAWENPAASREYIRAHAQEMDEDVLRTHIKTFVTEFSQDLGETGRAALRRLLSAAGCGSRDVFLDN